MFLSAEQIKDACKGKYLVEPLDDTVYAASVKIDSRKVKVNDLFVAFDGENVDGHDFIQAALNLRASIIVCEKDLNDEVLAQAKDNAASVIKVESSLQALTDIAILWRSHLMGKVIGITGSVGKTTVKKLVYDCLQIKYDVTANDGNYNNQIGLPVTLCKAEAEDDFVVTEMGMNKLGEISHLCEIAKPHWGLITNVGQAHMEFLGSQENIANAKGELAGYIPDVDGLMFMPTDDKYTPYIIDKAKLHERNIEVVYFGSTQYHEDLDAPQVWYEDLKVDKHGKSIFKICIKGFWNSETQKQDCELNLLGKFNVVNACAAIAICLKADISLSKVLEVLKKVEPEHGRFEILKAKHGVHIINDAYNANPQSMKASVEVLASMDVKGKKICVLGDMFELGEIEKTGHEEVGTCVGENDIDYLICVGKLSQATYEAAIKAGMNNNNAWYFENIEDAKAKLKEVENKGDYVLLKASNSMKFQDFAKELVS